MPRKKPENYVSRIKYSKEQINEFNKNNPGKEMDKYGNVYQDINPNTHIRTDKYDITDIINKVFNRLKVIKFMRRVTENGTQLYVKCYCTCKETDQNVVYVKSSELMSGRAKSCGCIQKEKASMSHYENLVGKIFGELTVLEECEERAKGQLRLWKCLCSCGNIVYVRTGDLNYGHTTSCGHIRAKNSKIANTKHGESSNRLYKLLQKMKDRCSNPNCPRHRHYYDKGIKVCDEWKDNYLAFKEWSLKNGYDDTKTIDRTDSNKDYCPENCRWVDVHTQCCNTSQNVTTIDCYVPADLLRLANVPNIKGIRKLYPDIDKITIRDFCDRIFGEGNNYDLLPQVVRHHTSEFISEMTNYLIDIYKEIHDICYPKDGTKRKISSGICQEWLMNRRAFIDWAIDNGYYKDYKIGLIDPNKDYSPDNCFIDYNKNT